MRLQFHVEIDNSTGGAITYVAGRKRTQIGSVERPATAPVLAGDGFWASKYTKAIDGTAGHVLATSVYVLRMKVDPDREYDPTNPWEWTTRLVNVRPDRYHDADHGRWLDDTIYTNIPGGSHIFGGNSAPPVGSPLRYFDDDSDSWRSITEYYQAGGTGVPRRLRFSVYRPAPTDGALRYIEFENWGAGDTVGGATKPSNGRITVTYANGTRRHIADVLQRVRGTGRFGGTEFAHIGQIDTNHPGAFTFSTSPYVGFSWDQNVRGGLQIVPANHVKWLSYNLGQDSFIDRSQWLIVGSVGADREVLRDERYLIDGQLSFEPAWEAIAPLFGMYVRTSFNPRRPDMGTSFVVSEDFGRTWHESPEIVGVSEPPDSPVDRWTNIRVRLSYRMGP